MLIDRKAIPWIIVCIAIFVIAFSLYIPYARHADGRPSGGSVIGLTYGIAGFAAMVAAMLLAARKKTRALRLGRTYSWMQAHVWFGFLSYPLIIFHAGGFHWGGTLAKALMWLFTVVMASGIIGLLLQQIIPRRMMRMLPAETIYEQIGHILQLLRQEATVILRSVRSGGSRSQGGGSFNSPSAETSVGTALDVEPVGAEVAVFEGFFEKHIQTFLGDVYAGRSLLAAESSSRAAFAQWVDQLPAELHPAAFQLQAIVNERRQLAQQRRLHQWLHGWLIVHVPLSYLLMALAVIHAIVAFRYTSPGR